MRYTASQPFNVNQSDNGAYWDRGVNDDFNTIIPYTNPHGTFFWAAESVDWTNPGAEGMPPLGATTLFSELNEETMDQPLVGRRILIFVGDIYEDLEVWYPKLRMIEAGAKVVMVGPEAKHQYSGKNGYPCTTDVAIADVQVGDFDGLIVPGGFMPDKLRRDIRVLEIVRQFDAAGKLIAAICHGGWIPISAGVYRGVRVTGSLGIKDDLVNAGAIWEDYPVVVDRHFVSSRKPDDLPEFCRGILNVLTS